MKIPRAFTLLPVVVCVAICTVLAGLLIATPSKMRLRADEAGLVSNLRKVSAAVLALAADNESGIPSVVRGINHSTMWQFSDARYFCEYPDVPEYYQANVIRCSALRVYGDKTILGFDEC